MRSLCLWAAIATAFPLLAGENPDRIFWIIPNHRASTAADAAKPLTARQKFGMATAEATDPGNIALALIFGAQGQYTNANPPFGQGAAGFARYSGAALGDQIVGDYMGVAVFPSLLHQDPRYFRRGTGSFAARFGAAALQLFRTRSDSGHQQFNYSNVLGAVSAMEISNLYYRGDNGLATRARALGMQFSFGLMGNLLTEFWPDIHRKLSRKPH